ncbi:MAG: hypothetical protein U0Y10_02115 [Spirosomataceae bacterium]
MAPILGVEPGGFSSTSSQPSRSPVTTSMAGIYSVTVNNGGCSATASVSVSVNSNLISASGNNVCLGASISLSASPSGGTYAWAYPSSFSSTAQNPTRSGASSAMDGVYSVSATLGGCSSSATVNIDVIVVTATASSNAPCVGSNLNLSATPNGGSYNWSPLGVLAVRLKPRPEPVPQQV